jgi:Putative DNA-binding domain
VTRRGSLRTPVTHRRLTSCPRKRCPLIPETLDGWTVDIIRALVAQGAFETDRFDFKEKLPDPRDDAGKSRLRRDVSAFANAAGGFLVYGVKDDKGLSAEDRVVGLEGTEDFPERFGNFPRACEPTVDWSFRNPPIALASGRVVHVVHVPESPRKPHGLFEDERWWFTKRTNKGTEPMSYVELRAAFSSTREKLAKLRMLIAEVQHLHDHARVVNARGSSQGSPATSWRGAPPDAYDHSVITALTPDVLDLLVHDATIASLLPRLRVAAQRADETRRDPSLAHITPANARGAAHAFASTTFQVLQTARLLLPLGDRSAAPNGSTVPPSAQSPKGSSVDRSALAAPPPLRALHASSRGSSDGDVAL